MEILVKNISDIIFSEVNLINDKVKGLNFLETLKANIIEKISFVTNEQKFPLSESFDFEKDFEKNISILIKYFTKPVSINKKIMKYDSLFITFNETVNFDIYQNEKKYISVDLYKNNGISLPKSSVLNSRYNKNTLLLEIQNKSTEQLFTK
jgi:hypothetical protein